MREVKSHLNPFKGLQLDQAADFGRFEIMLESLYNWRQRLQTARDMPRTPYAVLCYFGINHVGMPLIRVKGTNPWYALGSWQASAWEYRPRPNIREATEVITEWKWISLEWWEEYREWKKQQTAKLRKKNAKKKREKAERYGLSVRELEEKGLTDKQQAKDVKYTKRLVKVGTAWSKLQDEMEWIESDNKPTKAQVRKAKSKAEQLCSALSEFRLVAKQPKS